MIKRKIKALADRIEDGLRSLTGRISPDGRVFIILVMLILFGGGSIYMTVSSIYNMGKRNGKQMQIKHIERLELRQKQERDSINLIKEFRYE